MTVALVFTTDLHYSREIILGAQSYLRAAGIRHIVINSVTDASIESISARQDVSGVITAVYSEHLEKKWAEVGRPVVNTSSRFNVTKMPSVLPDNEAIGRIAAEHFIQRGFRNFGFLGDLGILFSSKRFAGFRDRLGQLNPVSVIETNERGQMRKWLAELRRPCGVFAMSDHHAMRVIEACLNQGLRVPEDIAILGVDNDGLTCAVAPVPLSSVDPNAHKVGFRAAQLIEKLLLGHEVAVEPVYVAPDHVVVRESTDAVAVEDPEIASVVQYIQQHACDAMRIDDMIDQLALTRRTMERRFKAYFGYTLHDEIRRVRLERAKQLLVKTPLKVPAIARRCGFQDAKRFSADFKRFVGKTPSEFRRNE